VQIGAQAQVCGIGDRKVIEDRDVSAGGHLGAFGGGGDSAISAARDVPLAHDSSVMSRYTAYSANQVITTTAMTSRISKKSTTAQSLALLGLSRARP
jgi:hypothetical protein